MIQTRRYIRSNASKACCDPFDQIIERLKNTPGILDIQFDQNILSVTATEAFWQANEQASWLESLTFKNSSSVSSSQKEPFFKHEVGNDHLQEVDDPHTPFLIVLSLLLYIPGLILDHFQASPLGQWSPYVFYGLPYLVCGYPILKRGLQNLFQLKWFDEFTLMSITTLAAILIGSLAEAAGVMIFYSLGEWINDRVAHRSRRSIRALLATKPQIVHQLIDDTLIDTHPEALMIGDRIIVRPGERIPLDGKITKGTSQLDTSPLTGESLPITVNPGDLVQSGTINLGSQVTIEVTAIYADSSIARIIDIVESATQHKSLTERFITRFARYYTPFVVLLALSIGLLGPWLLGGEIKEWIYRALVMLVISCPCALVLAIPLSYFGGIGAASKQGLLVKGSDVLDTLTDIQTLAFDKTGTLTQGCFTILSMHPPPSIAENTLLEAARIAESGSNHPLAQSIRKVLDHPIPLVVETTEIPGEGVETWYEGHRYLSGNLHLMKRFGFFPPKNIGNGTHVHVAQDETYLGYLVLGDGIKKGVTTALDRLRQQNITSIWMLTGDTDSAAATVAEQLQLDGYKAALMPTDKMEVLNELRLTSPNHKAAFVGDGFNDAPILASADVGIAMGGIGSEAAIEISDVIVLDDRIEKVADLFDIAKYTRKIVWQNIIMALGIKLVFLSLGAMGIASLWEAIFADVGVTLLAVLNATRTSYLIPSAKQEP